MNEYVDTDFDAIATRCCERLPDGYVIQASFENGAFWIVLLGPNGAPLDLPDSADKAPCEQLNDALCIANGWKLDA
jgi:hypothetical protein